MYYPKNTIPSMVTSFHADGSLDLAGMAENIQFQKAAGVKSICVLGGTGEAASMTREERHAVMEETMRNADGLDVVFGALAGRPEDVMVDILKAKELGAKACLVMATPFVRPSEQDIYNLMKYYATAGQPLIVFNTPGRSSVNMSAALVSRMNADIPEVVGIKESSGNMALFQDIRVGCPAPFSAMTGGDDIYFETLCVGGVGGILAAAAAIPEVFVALDNAFAAKDYDTACKCSYAIKRLNDVLYTASHPVPLKIALEFRGLPVGIARPPFSNVTPEHEASVIQAMKDIRKDCEGIVEFVEKYPIKL